MNHKSVRAAKNDVIETTYQIEAAVNGIERAKEGNATLKARVARFRSYAVQNKDVLFANHGWKSDLDRD